MRRIVIFCGSSYGNHPSYREAARMLGVKLAEREIGVVYGGAQVGLMGCLADGALQAGGEVIGVIPTFLKTVEIAHAGLTELIEVENMHQRKTKMHELSDGIIALPGGFGTLEEFFEMLTWAQLGLHNKPLAILNVNGFYDGLINMISTMVDEGFLKTANQKMVLIDSEIESLIEKMSTYTPIRSGKWISTDEV